MSKSAVLLALKGELEASQAPSDGTGETGKPFLNSNKMAFAQSPQGNF